MKHFFIGKIKKGINITNASQNILKESNRKPNKIWVDKDSECYKGNHGLKKNDIEVYSTHNKGKSVIAERYFRTLKNKIHEYMTSVSKNVYIDKLDDIIHNKYNNTYHTTSKATPADLRSNTYITSSKEVNDKNLKFKICDNFRMSKYKIAFAKFTLQIG